MTQQSLDQRITTLERSNRRWRAGCLALLGVIAIGFVVAAEKAPAPAEIVQARRFELIDAQGHPAIVLQSDAKGASLAVWGPDHGHAAVLVGQPNKAALMLMKNTNTPEVFAEAVDQGGQIGVTNGQPGQAMNLTGSPSGFSLFQVVNGQPESRLSFSNLGGGLELRTPGGKAVTRVIGSEKGGRIEITNTEGQPVWSAPPAPDLNK